VHIGAAQTAVGCSVGGALGAPTGSRRQGLPFSLLADCGELVAAADHFAVVALVALVLVPLGTRCPGGASKDDGDDGGIFMRFDSVYDCRSHYG
jgi:hypothetical protein